MDFFKIVKESVSFESVANYHGIEFNPNGKALCRFHSEKTPSFQNYRTHAYCFSCGQSVDAIDLEVHFTGLKPFEAALSLAKRYGVQVPEYSHKDKQKFAKQLQGYKILKWLAMRANKNIKRHPEVLDFLRMKGIDAKDIDHWQLGYVGNDNSISTRLIDNPNFKLAKEMGLINDNGDRFKNRIIVPIWNNGRIVYLSGRAYPDSTITKYNPKYLHLKNSHLVYRQIAFPENLRKDKCLIVESVTDAIASIKSDYFACALLGTNPGEKDRQTLKNANAELYFCLDRDKPGREASYRLAVEYQGYVVDLGYGKDASEALAAKGIDKFKEIAEKAINEAKYYLDLVIEREEPIECLREIAKLKFSSEKEPWLKRLSENFDIPIDVLKADLNEISDQSVSDDTTVNKNIFNEIKPKIHPAIDLINDKLVYGIPNGKNPIFIHDRKILELSDISKSNYLDSYPEQSRFSNEAIKRYLNEEEIIDPVILYESIRDLLLKYIIFQHEWQVDLTVTWIMGTYVHRCFPLYPYYWIKSPTKRCGKTRLLELMAALCFNADGVETAPTEAVLFRLPSITGGTLLWDEVENLFKQREQGDLVSVLNTAYRKEGIIRRCEGKNHKIKTHGVYRPVALAGISTLPDTVSDRSLKIELLRKRRNEKVGRLQIERLANQLQKIRDNLRIFALDNGNIVVEAYNQFEDGLIPNEIDDRLRDALEVMISIAAPILYSQPSHFILSQLQTAALALSGIRNVDEEEGSFVKAINILKSEMDSNQYENLILTAEEAMNLFKDGGIDWVIEQKDARSMLRKLGLRSESHRVDDEVIRGYKIPKSKVEDLYLRYGGSHMVGHI